MGNEMEYVVIMTVDGPQVKVKIQAKSDKSMMFLKEAQFNSLYDAASWADGKICQRRSVHADLSFQ